MSKANRLTLSLPGVDRYAGRSPLPVRLFLYLCFAFAVFVVCGITIGLPMAMAYQPGSTGVSSVFVAFLAIFSAPLLVILGVCAVIRFARRWRTGVCDLQSLIFAYWFVFFAIMNIMALYRGR